MKEELIVKIGNDDIRTGREVHFKFDRPIGLTIRFLNGGTDKVDPTPVEVEPHYSQPIIYDEIRGGDAATQPTPIAYPDNESLPPVQRKVYDTLKKMGTARASEIHRQTKNKGALGNTRSALMVLQKKGLAKLSNKLWEPS